MTYQQQSPALPVEQKEEPLLENFLNSLAKALKAITFYPPGHPLRDECIVTVFNSVEPLIRNQELVLLWSRDSCTIADRPSLISRSAIAKTLAREMLKRKLQRLIILPQLSQADLKAFLNIITLDPAVIYSGGGIDAEMSRARITTIGSNEVDLSLLKGLQHEEESTAPEDALIEQSGPEEQDQIEEDEEDEQVEAPQDTQFSLLGLDILLGMLKAEKNEQQFQQLAREVIEATEELKRQGTFENLLPVFGELLDVQAAESRPSTQKEFIRYTMEQIASGPMTNFLLDKIEERSAENEVLLNRLCAKIGQLLAYPLIQRLCVAESLHARKTIAIALTNSGETAIAAILTMLKDERWYVVRNMVTILGEIGSTETVSTLQQTAKHPEPKVRKEVMKSLLKISPQAADNTLLELLNDQEKDVVRQAVYSLGAIRSRAAVAPLLEIVTSSDTFLKELSLKKQAIIALGRIGDRQATSALLDILTTRRWLSPGRWQEIKIAAATALGQMGDDSAIPLLKRLAAYDSPLGIACGDAADNLERLAK